MNIKQFTESRREQRRADFIGKIVAAVFVVLMAVVFGWILYHVRSLEGR